MITVLATMSTLRLLCVHLLVSISSFYSLACSLAFLEHNAPGLLSLSSSSSSSCVQQEEDDKDASQLASSLLVTISMSHVNNSSHLFSMMYYYLYLLPSLGALDEASHGTMSSTLSIETIDTLVAFLNKNLTNFSWWYYLTRKCHLWPLSSSMSLLCTQSPESCLCSCVCVTWWV